MSDEEKWVILSKVEHDLLVDEIDDLKSDMKDCVETNEDLHDKITNYEEYLEDITSIVRNKRVAYFGGGFDILAAEVEDMKIEYENNISILNADIKKLEDENNSMDSELDELKDYIKKLENKLGAEI